MEVKSLGSTSVNELFTEVQRKAQGSVDTSSRKAEAESREHVREWSEKELTEKVSALNQLSETQFTDLKFEKHSKLNRMMVRVVDRNTQEVIKEIPPEKFLDMISSMLEFAGIIIDERI